MPLRQSMGQLFRAESVFDREFVTADGWQAVLIRWESQDAFQAELGMVSQGPETHEFFSAAEIMAYQATLVK